jgi:NAD(P)H-quinone oxidoreductase subunit 5
MMMTLTQIGLSLPMVAVPIAYLVGALNAHLKTTRPAGTQLPALAALLAALVAVTGRVAGVDAQPLPLFSPSPVSLAVLVLIGFIGLIIARYSKHYLAGERNEQHYYRTLQLTLAAVSLVVISNHMLVLLGAWVAISLGLHQLLMFYPERPRAALAAHKRFLFARLAEASLLAAILLLQAAHGTWQIDQIVAAYPVAQLSIYEQLAALLLALTALITCAQLPVHGWLMQVVEAPTPVSALLHAGIINLGGYLLILFAPLLVQASAAQWLLLVVAGVTTLLSSLIMMTRISVKVKLAWSTSAQMGLMLVECALGLFELALLHLIAHSCYKAYAFLDAGSAVNKHLYRQLAPASRPSIWTALSAALLSTALVVALVAFLALPGPFSPWLLLIVTLTLLLTERASKQYAANLFSALGLAVVLVLVYSLQKSGAGWLTPALPASAGALADAWFGLLVALLFAGYIVLRYAPGSALGRRLWQPLYGGLYLDEWVTRTTLKIWPARLPTRANAKRLPKPLLNREML